MNKVEPVKAIETTWKGYALSMDALVLLTVWFAFGEKTKVEIGGSDANYHLSPRAKDAIDELINVGLVAAKPFNDRGRMTYTGTPDCRDLRLHQSEMDKYGHWSPTVPNPTRHHNAEGE